MENRERFLRRVSEITHPSYCQEKEQPQLVLEAWFRYIKGCESEQSELSREESNAISHMIEDREN